MTLDKEKKKELVSNYKQKITTGGVYQITNVKNNKCLIKAEIDLQSFQNRFAFSQKIGSCLHPKLKVDFDAGGANLFELEILEEVEQKPDESPRGFKLRLKEMEDKWKERFGFENLY